MTLLWDLIARRWWSWSPTQHSAFDSIYRGMNFVEGMLWFLLALLVTVRFLRNRRSALEPVYATLFLLFGVSDFVEMRAVDTWLILAKGAILLMLLAVRREVLRRYYPDCRTY